MALKALQEGRCDKTSFARYRTGKVRYGVQPHVTPQEEHEGGGGKSQVPWVFKSWEALLVLVTTLATAHRRRPRYWAWSQHHTKKAKAYAALRLSVAARLSLPARASSQHRQRK